jgi:hypothetical protein
MGVGDVVVDEHVVVVVIGVARQAARWAEQKD